MESINNYSIITILIFCFLTTIFQISTLEGSPIDYKIRIDKFVKNYQKIRNGFELKKNILSLKGIDCQTLLKLVQDKDIHYMARYELIELFKEDTAKCPNLKCIVDLMDLINNAFLKSKIAKILGDIGEDEGDLSSLRKMLDRYEKEREALWNEAQAFPETNEWLKNMKRFSMWSYGQKRMAACNVFFGAETPGELPSELVNNYLILFNLFDSLWQIEGRISKNRFNGLGLNENEKKKYINENFSRSNRYIRYFILEHLMMKKEGFKIVREMWNPDDIFFSLMYIDVIGEHKVKELVTFLLDEFGALFEKYDLHDEIPSEFLNPDACNFIEGWQIAVLSPNFTKTISDIGDIRAILVDYFDKHPRYQGKTLLLSIIDNQVLNKRIELAKRDSIDEMVLRFLKRVRSDKAENPLVREKAQEIYNTLQ